MLTYLQLQLQWKKLLFPSAKNTEQEALLKFKKIRQLNGWSFQ